MLVNIQGLSALNKGFLYDIIISYWIKILNKILSLGDISLIPRLAISNRAAIFLITVEMSPKCHRIIFVIILGT